MAEFEPIKFEHEMPKKEGEKKEGEKEPLKLVLDLQVLKNRNEEVFKNLENRLKGFQDLIDQVNKLSQSKYIEKGLKIFNWSLGADEDIHEKVLGFIKEQGNRALANLMGDWKMYEEMGIQLKKELMSGKGASGKERQPMGELQAETQARELTQQVIEKRTQEFITTMNQDFITMVKKQINRLIEVSYGEETKPTEAFKFAKGVAIQTPGGVATGQPRGGIAAEDSASVAARQLADQ